MLIKNNNNKYDHIVSAFQHVIHCHLQYTLLFKRIDRP